MRKFSSMYTEHGRSSRARMAPSRLLAPGGAKPLSPRTGRRARDAVEGRRRHRARGRARTRVDGVHRDDADDDATTRDMMTREKMTRGVTPRPSITRPPRRAARRRTSCGASQRTRAEMPSHVGARASRSSAWRGVGTASCVVTGGSWMSSPNSRRRLPRDAALASCGEITSIEDNGSDCCFARERGDEGR